MTHIEKGSRNPSHKALREITSALGVPFEQLYYTYDKTLGEKEIYYDYVKYVNYNKVPAISHIDEYIDCPANFANASFAYKMPDNSMEPIFKEDSYVFVEINGVVKHREIGFFRVNNQYYIRQLLYKKNGFVLRANGKIAEDIQISNYDDFQIIGKVYI